jgi:hypothetical protein
MSNKSRIARIRSVILRRRSLMRRPQWIAENRQVRQNICCEGPCVARCRGSGEQKVRITMLYYGINRRSSSVKQEEGESVTGIVLFGTCWVLSTIVRLRYTKRKRRVL